MQFNITSSKIFHLVSVVGLLLNLAFAFHPLLASRNVSQRRTLVVLNEIDVEALVSSDGVSGYDGDIQGYTRDLTKKGFFARFRRISEPGRMWIHRAAARRREQLMYEAAMGGSKKSKAIRAITAPFRFAKRNFIQQKPGTLILIRNGESLGTVSDTLSGWTDYDMTERGYRECIHAARLIKEAGYDLDLIFSSRLRRSIYAARAICKELGEEYLPVLKSWRLNDRSYGALTGRTREEVEMDYGRDMLDRWTGVLKECPPPLTPQDPRWPGRDRRYSDMIFNSIPVGESLQDCIDRIRPAWEDKILTELEAGHNVMVVSHRNALRGLMRLIDGIGNNVTNDEIEMPAGVPIVYNFDKNMKPIRPDDSSQSFQQQSNISGLFLEEPGLLKKVFDKEFQLRPKVEGYSSILESRPKDLSPMERTLTELNIERTIDDNKNEKKGKNDRIDEDTIGENGNISLTDLQRNSRYDFYNSDILPGSSLVCKDPVIVMIRHGETRFNKLGLFTGWNDVALTQQGVEQAKEAGRLLQKNGFEFDVVYTSWLSRAIETAWHVMDQMQSIYLPVIKSWRLNERMYGDLTSKSKKMISRIHGPEQFKAWRRGYKVRPPPVSSFDTNYPGNDKRYVKYLKDLRISFSDSLIRTIDKRKLSIVRKYPKAESLHDCMKRTIPYFRRNIVPDAINKGKRVLIASSENAIRGLIMYLCEIPEKYISELSIPNGVPLIYDVRSKCIKLLDDESGRNPLETHNFGPAAPYLFRPCQNEDGTEDDECDIRWMDEALWKSEEKPKSPDFIPRPKLKENMVSV